MTNPFPARFSLRGAVDLSALVQRQRRPPSQSTARTRGPAPDRLRDRDAAFGNAQLCGTVPLVFALWASSSERSKTLVGRSSASVPAMASSSSPRRRRPQP